MVPVSAKKKQNLDQLLEMILLSTDILELKANPKHSASGTVLEAKLDRGPRSGRNRPRAGRHAERRRQLHRGAGRRPRARAHRRPWTFGEAGAAIDPCRSPRADEPARSQAIQFRPLPTRQRPGRLRPSGRRRRRNAPSVRAAAA
jgi:hypothetical protein